MYLFDGYVASIYLSDIRITHIDARGNNITHPQHAFIYILLKIKTNIPVIKGENESGSKSKKNYKVSVGVKCIS